MASAIHIIAAVLWVGGMFFAYQVLRPAAGAMEPPARLALWGRVFARFFPWVWAAAVLLPLTGYYRLFMDMGGFSGAGLHIHIMHMTGIIMVGIYVYLYFSPYRYFKQFVADENWPEAGAKLNMIRKIVLINLIIGLITVVAGSTGTYWPILY